MSTLRDLISRVRSTHKLLSGDGSISDRAIAAEIKSANLMLMKRETDKRKLWSTDSAFHSIDCLDLKEVSLNECCEGPEGVMLARSVAKLPNIAEGNNGHLIQGVYNLTGSKKIDEVTLNRYINLLKIKPIKKENYFFILDNYLYVTNPDIQSVRIRAHFEDEIPNELLPSSETCKNPLDREYKFPGYLETAIISLTSQSLLGTYFRLNNDKIPDQKDDQVSKS